MNKLDVISFDLKGDFACFRKNDTNDIVYTTYNFIHRPAILGILGSISGLSGYAQTKVENRKRQVPEYYQVFRNVRIAIIPLFKNPLPKEILTFNNSSGMASSESGGNLQVKEQQLIGIGKNVIFRIFVILDDIKDKKAQNELKDNLRKEYSIYPLYLGKNECLAFYDNVTQWEGITFDKEASREEIEIRSLIPFDYLKEPFTYDINLFDTNERLAPRKLVFENLPIDFDEYFIYKKVKTVWLAQGSVKLQKFENIYKLQNGKSNETIAYFLSGNNRGEKDEQ